jgi:hypothetical protein
MINKSRSFGYNLDHGATPEELKKWGAMTDREYERVIRSLTEIRGKRNGGK